MKLTCNTVILEYGCGGIVNILAEAEYVKNLLQKDVEFKFNGVVVHIDKRSVLSQDLSTDCAMILEAVKSGEEKVYL